MNELQDSAKERGPAGGVFGRFCLRLLRRGLFVLACLATLIGLFYAVENWRGKRAWEKCRRELEAKGAVLDWNAFIPAPVPDEQNIFKAPRMAEWFVKGSLVGAVSDESSKSGNTAAPFSLAPRPAAKRDSVLVAEVEVVPRDAPLPAGKADTVLRFDDPATGKQAAQLLRERLGPCARDVWGSVILARPPDQINPVHLVLQADTVPNAQTLAEFFPGSAVPYNGWNSSDLHDFQVVPAGTNAFRVSLRLSVNTPADYLAASEPAVPDLNLLRKALERPCARMDSDYQRPYERPVPNFIRLRTVAQMLSQRTQCCLLLGQPEAAWHELALVRDMCHMLEAKPASDCPTLVEVMIDVAISGLYVSIVQDGLRLQVWREPELAAMEKQLGEINFLPLLARGFRAERAATCRTFEVAPPPPAELRKWLFFGDKTPSLWASLKNPTFLLLTVFPRGWTYQNMCAGTRLEQPLFETFDIPNNRVLPGKLTHFRDQAEAASKGIYSFLAAMALPNFVKATQTMARNQTLVNEACIACRLERYRLARGQYPETLESLVPQFAAKLPHDIVGGQPLKYHRTPDGRFVLYAIGWNEKDDGGVPGKTIGEGDWVWQ